MPSTSRPSPQSIAASITAATIAGQGQAGEIAGAGSVGTTGSAWTRWSANALPGWAEPRKAVSRSPVSSHLPTSGPARDSAGTDVPADSPAGSAAADSTGGETLRDHRGQGLRAQSDSRTTIARPLGTAGVAASGRHRRTTR